MTGQVTALSFYMIADSIKQLREILVWSSHLMDLRYKAQHRLNCIVDGRNAYCVEWFRVLRLILCKIRLVSNDTQPLDMFPFQFHMRLSPTRS